MDRIFANHSAYSYEDLPTDKVAAVFGASYFDPNSNLTFAEFRTTWHKALGIKDNRENRHIIEQPKPVAEVDSGFSSTPWIFAIAVLVGFIFAFNRKKKQ